MNESQNIGCFLGLVVSKANQRAELHRVESPSVFQLEVVSVNRRSVNLAFPIALPLTHNHSQILTNKLALRKLFFCEEAKSSLFETWLAFLYFVPKSNQQSWILTNWILWLWLARRKYRLIEGFFNQKNYGFESASYHAQIFKPEVLRDFTESKYLFL